MKAVEITLVIVVIGLLAYAGCTKLKEELPAANEGLVKVHEAGWSDSSSSSFHGRVLKAKDWDLTGCQPCHGSNFQGGTSGVSCYTCHVPYPHPDLWDTTFVGYHTSLNFHGTFLRMKGWHLDQCRACHGADYNGGQVEFTCMNSGCHVDASGKAKSPEACNTCHGVFHGHASDTLSWAPPRAINGDTTESSTGVGVHQAHLRAGEISNVIECKQCHRIPSSVSMTGHLDALPTEIVQFDSSLAGLKTANRTFDPQPVFDPNTATCSNTYCHGNWKSRASDAIDNFAYSDSVMVGNSFTPVWTDTTGAAAQCGTCHGTSSSPAPTGHIDVGDATSCGGCHVGVVDETGKIADKTLHMNGKVNVFGQERDF
jgi:predicted CxxxxCH...CXXCH cytochrome family protein